MKKYIRANDGYQNSKQALFEEVLYYKFGKYVEEEGYRVTYLPGFKLEVNHKDKFMPKISIETFKDSEGDYSFFCDVDLNVHFEMDSTRADDMSWYGKRWIKVFKAVENLEQVQFDPDDYVQ